MRLKTLLLTLAIGLAPTLAAACPGHDQQAMSCAEGHIWDAEAGTCVPVATG